MSPSVSEDCGPDCAAGARELWQECPQHQPLGAGVCKWHGSPSGVQLASENICLRAVCISEGEHVLGSSAVWSEDPTSGGGLREKNVSFDLPVICLTLQGEKQITVDNDKNAER